LYVLTLSVPFFVDQELSVFYYQYRSTGLLTQHVATYALIGRLVRLFCKVVR
jgi:hypothetical protein